MATKSNNAGLATLRQWLSAIFHVNVPEYDSYVDLFYEVHSMAEWCPYGLERAIWVPERFPVAASLYDPKPSGKLMKVALEALDEYQEPVYLLLSDSTQVGRASLWLVRAHGVGAYTPMQCGNVDWIGECAAHHKVENAAFRAIISSSPILRGNEDTRARVFFSALQLKSCE